MKVSAVITGDEVLYGRVADENGRYVAERVRQTGNEMLSIIFVGDSPDDVASAVSELSSKSHLVVVSGGLGATGDDVTRPALEKMGFKLVESPLARARIERIMRARGYKLKDAERKALLFPEGGKELRNPAGLALGINVRFRGADVYFLPGVPNEFRATFDLHVLPVLKRSRRDVWFTRFVLFGMREVELEEKLKAVGGLEGVKISFLPSYPLLNVEASGTDENLRRTFEGVMEEVASGHIFVRGEKSPAEVIKHVFTEKRATLSSAESATGGLIASMITDVPGASNYFLAGYITYSAEDKVKTLDVDPEVIRRFGVVSGEVATHMCEGASRKSGSTWAISTTGYAGPDGGDEKNPVGTVYVGVAKDGACIDVRRFQFHGDRLRLKRTFALSALFTLYEKVRNE